MMQEFNSKFELQHEQVLKVLNKTLISEDKHPNAPYPQLHEQIISANISLYTSISDAWYAA